MRLHLRLNRCSNVEVIMCALGAAAETGDLHVVLGTDSGCNSLRPPEVSQPTDVLPVAVERLDDVLKARGIDQVDFIKLDVEGAELSVLQGASELLRRSLRPVILSEVQDLRTKPWGYRAKEILTHLRDANFTWFRLLDGGSVESLDLGSQTFDGNFVACPKESIHLLSLAAIETNSSGLTAATSKQTN